MNKIVNYQDQKSDLSIYKELAATAMKSGNYPNMTEAAILNLMLSAKDLGVSPMKAINGGFYIVNGRVCMSTALMADRIRSAGHSIQVREWSKEKCVVVGTRKDNGDKAFIEFTWEDGTLAGLTGSATWKKYPKVMLYNRAMSMLARVLFPDVVGQCYSEDEGQEIRRNSFTPPTLVDEEILHAEIAAPPVEQDQDAILKTLIVELQATVEIPEKEDYLADYLAFCEEKATRPMATVIRGWIEEPQPFVKHYRSWIAKKKIEVMPSSDMMATA